MNLLRIHQGINGTIPYLFFFFFWINKRLFHISYYGENVFHVRHLQYFKFSIDSALSVE